MKTCFRFSLPSHLLRILLPAVTLLLFAPLSVLVRGQEPSGNPSAPTRILGSEASHMLLNSKEPVYPPIAEAARVSGTVVLDVTISKTGEVEEARVISGPAMLQQAALDAVKTWRYKPYLLNGQPVEVSTMVSVVFHLPPPGESAAVRQAEQTMKTLAEDQQRWDQGLPSEGMSVTPDQAMKSMDSQAQQQNQVSDAEIAQYEKAAKEMDRLIVEAEGQPFQVGGVTVALTVPPVVDMVEAGDDRTMFEPVVPEANRIVAAYVRKEDLPALHSGAVAGIPVYALVEAPRAQETVNVLASDFPDLADMVGKRFGLAPFASFKESEDEFNARMKAMNLDQQVSDGKPVMLGTFFYNPSALGFGVIVPNPVNEKTTEIVMGAMLFRARARILYAKIYMNYKDAGTPDVVRTLSKEWMDSILQANQ